MLNSRCGVEDSGVSDYVVFMDAVIQVFYPKDILDAINKVFDSAKGINDVNIKKLSELVFERKTTIPVIITRNHVLAEQLRNRVLSYFKE